MKPEGTNQREPDGEYKLRCLYPLPEPLLCLVPPVLDTVKVKTQKICVAVAFQAAQHQSGRQLNKYPSDIKT